MLFHGVCNGVFKGVVNGVFNGVFNGVCNGVCNGVLMNRILVLSCMIDDNERKVRVITRNKNKLYRTGC